MCACSLGLQDWVVEQTVSKIIRSQSYMVQLSKIPLVKCSNQKFRTRELEFFCNIYIGTYTYTYIGAGFFRQTMQCSAITYPSCQLQYMYKSFVMYYYYRNSSHSANYLGKENFNQNSLFRDIHSSKHTNWGYFSTNTENPYYYQDRTV